MICAPSGAGKSTLIARLSKIFPDMLYSVSCTTRRPRTGETDGVSYYFLSRNEFQERIEKGGFLEWKEVHGNLYGTPGDPVEKALANGRRMILDVDVQGALEVFKRIERSVGIFITVPDLQTIEKRLRLRGTESEEDLKIRLSNAAKEMEQIDYFQYVVENDDLEEATRLLAEIIQKESIEKMGV